MSCNTCAKQFGFLRKEKGCPNCGFSYCAKCLEHKMFVKKLNCEAKVCVTCKNAKSMEESNVTPPDAYFKRVESTENKVIEQKLKKLKDKHPQPPSQQLTTDQEISERLKKLKGDVPTTSDAEIKERLAKLRGVPTSTLESKPTLPVADLRSEQEQADDLMKQYLEQCKIDSKYKNEFDETVSDMEQRLQKLKGENPSQSTTVPNDVDSTLNDDELAKKIVDKYKAEGLLAESEIEAMSPDTNDELPFCEICNEDATLRCLGCRYLFCKRCYLDHKDDDDGCNRYEPYKAPKTAY